MKEIKFRAWDTKKNRFDYEPLIARGECCYIDSFDNFENYEEGRMVLQQYTGLNDKNGKEIYEGDVIIGEAEIPCRVTWDMKNGCFRGSAINMSHVTIPAEAFTRREIIGNIYENAELLEVTT